MRDPARSQILSECRTGEVCVVIVPSERVLAGPFAVRLKAEGIGLRVLAHGAGRIVDRSGKPASVKGLLVLAVGEADLGRVDRRARLFGVGCVRLQDPPLAG